ncbi:MAG: hypothetical protein FJY66_00490 [Calditrichaeota bacterium]|nr:hypothetical protein [Calditrichota bacterium]
MKPTSFEKSARKAIRWLAALSAYVERRAVHGVHPPVEEILEQSRKVGCALPALESYVREQSAVPALALFGADPKVAERFAGRLSFPVSFPPLPTSTIVWEVRGGSHDSYAVHFQDSKRRISDAVLAAFLKRGVAGGNIVKICQSVRTETPSRWRFFWIPWPVCFEAFWETPMGMGLLARQHGAVIVMEETPAPLVAVLREVGQRRWEIHQHELQNEEALARLEKEVDALIETVPTQQSVRETASWQWLRDRCQASLQRRGEELRKLLEQQLAQRKRIEQFLSHYRHSWLHGFRNQIESHLQQAAKTAAMEKLVKGKEVTAGSFLQAIALGTLRSKLESFAVDRLAEFIEGLGALTTKLEIPKVGLAQNHTPWAAGELAAKLEAAFRERNIFTKKKDRGFLMKRIGGHSPRQEEERRRELEQAIAVSCSIIEASWSSWSSAFFADWKRRMEETMETALTSAGKPTVRLLQEKMVGMNSLTGALHGQTGEKTGCASSVVAHWLRHLGRCQLLPVAKSNS